MSSGCSLYFPMFFYQSSSALISIMAILSLSTGKAFQRCRTHSDNFIGAFQPSDETDILSSTRLEQTPGSNGLFHLLSLSVRLTRFFFFIILTLFFFIKCANWNISGFKFDNKSNANVLTLEEAE